MAGRLGCSVKCKRPRPANNVNLNPENLSVTRPNPYANPNTTKEMKNLRSVVTQEYVTCSLVFSDCENGQLTAFWQVHNRS